MSPDNVENLKYYFVSERSILLKLGSVKYYCRTFDLLITEIMLV